MLWSETDYFGLLRNNHILVYDPNISYRKINVYMVEKMDMGRSHWNNGVSGTDLISISTMVNIVRDKIIW